MTHESEELNEVRLLLQSARGHIAEMKAEGLRREAYEAPLALNDPRRARLNRLMADAMALWRQCERPACRRARRCRGLPGACVARHAAAVPAPVREGAELLPTSASRTAKIWALGRCFRLLDLSQRHLLSTPTPTTPISSLCR